MSFRLSATRIGWITSLSLIGTAPADRAGKLRPAALARWVQVEAERSGRRAVRVLDHLGVAA